MREIKFRIPMFTDKEHFIEFQHLNLGDDLNGTLCGHNGEPQQFTGLLDKNGKEIYEGDIIKFINHQMQYDPVSYGALDTEEVETLGVVSFEEDRYMCGNFELICVLGDMEQGEIIGNVWENPDLLK